MTDLSIIICTHNPRFDYLKRVLDALKAQSLPKERWELLLIDNASKEPLSSAWDLSWHPYARHILEVKLGLTPARLRGIEESQSEIILFVDDDNVLQADYLEVLLKLVAEHSQLGCLGAGILEPEFEQEPTAELRPYTEGLACLALCSLPSARWSNFVDDGYLPMGAGLAVRREVAVRYLAVVQSCPIRVQLDRRGSVLNSGGDLEFSWIACELGLGKGMFPSLKITHLIDQRRVGKQYLLSIAQGHAFSDALLACLHGKPILSSTPPSTFGDILSNFFSAKLSSTIYHARSWRRARRKSAIERDFDEACRSGVEQARNFLNETEAQRVDAGLS